MKTKALLGAGILALGLLASARSAAAGDTKAPWLHVRVEEPGRSSRVHVNLPLNVVEIALKAAPDVIGSHGRIHFGRETHGMSLVDFRKMWTELKAAGDIELVTVEDKDENVKVMRKGGVVEVRVDRKGREEVKVEIPVEVVDALLSGEDSELNVKAALLTLQKRRGDIVRVNDEHSSVRIWIDEQS